MFFIYQKKKSCVIIIFFCFQKIYIAIELELTEKRQSSHDGVDAQIVVFCLFANSLSSLCVCVCSDFYFTKMLLKKHIYRYCAVCTGIYTVCIWIYKARNDQFIDRLCREVLHKFDSLTEVLVRDPEFENVSGKKQNEKKKNNSHRIIFEFLHFL